MSRKLLLSSIAVFVLSSFIVLVGADTLIWDKTYGGTEADGATSLVETIDGGYAMAGFTYSFATEGSSILDNDDFWLVKTDAYGNMEWNKTYGGTEHETADSLIATSDGGYVLAGGTYSFGAGSLDFWLIKTDANGNMEWNKTYGGTGFENVYSMIATSDGGYAIAGLTSSFGAGMNDFWLVKTDEFGNMEWNQTYGREFYDWAHSVVETSDGGFALLGVTYDVPSLDFTVPDVLFVKTDAYGNMQWNRTYETQMGVKFVEVPDGGFLIAGANLTRTDEFGNILWSQTYGKPGGIFDGVGSLVATSDGGYVIAGTRRFDVGVTDMWLIKTDAYGNMQWNQTYGGTGEDSFGALLEISDGGYAIAGSTRSFGAGNYDFWLIKTDETGYVPEYSSWLLPSLLLMATLVIVIYKKKLFHPGS